MATRSSMAVERRRTDRRFAVAPTVIRPAAALVEFRDGWGEIDQRYDLGTLALPADITLLLAEAFSRHHPASSRETRRGCWRSLQVFARFVHADGGVAATCDLSTALISRYIAWLDAQRGPSGKAWSSASRANYLVALRQLIDWTKRHHPERLPTRLDFPQRPYSKLQVQNRTRLPEPQLKAILRACYEEIDAAWARFESGRRMLDGAEVAEVPADVADAIRRLAELDGGVLPSRLAAQAAGCRMQAIDRHGGLRQVGGYLHLMPDALVAFFIALAIQTAANPDALRRLRRDCKVPHPLDEHRVIIDWDKPRAGRRVRRAQRRSFDRRRRYAAPNLIDKLLAMTTPLVARAARRDREQLFLVKSEKSRSVGVMPEGGLSYSVKRFIARSNARIAIWNQALPQQPRTPLPDFSAALLRGSVATEHYQASGGDILVAQQLLNHASVSTTETYVRGPAVRQLQQETVARLQRLMLAWLDGESSPAAAPCEVPTALGSTTTAPFGHHCLNPLAGTAPGSAPGQACPHLVGCLRCPGLVIPLDVEHLARILQAQEEFERARERLDPRRWELLYADSYRILVQDILPDFPEGLRQPALALAAMLPKLPALE
jgi:hypothetical protein